MFLHGQGLNEAWLEIILRDITLLSVVSAVMMYRNQYLRTKLESAYEYNLYFSISQK